MPQLLPPTRLARYPEGPAGIAATLDQMVAFTHDAKHDPAIRIFAARLVNHLPQKAFLAEIAVCFRYVRDQVRYVQDVWDVETLQIPRFTLSEGYGDCDDKSMLLASFLLCIGVQTQFIAIGLQPNSYEHVYVQALDGMDPSNKRAWISLDPTEDRPMGWFPPGIACSMIRRV